ncbi:MAG: glycosyltransferase [Nocardioidaceae bacterium]|nr:glycosyltransferase [Nocardioidaceae bacterium]
MSSSPPSCAQDLPRPRDPITAVLVVVPAHDEEDRIGACLDSVRRAVDELARVDADLAISVVVVLDRCTDDTSAVVGVRHDVTAVAIGSGCVGAARRAGIRHGTADLDHDPAGVLVVNTDADCTVPARWLVEHLALASACDLVLGEVEPDAGEMSPASLALWRARHPLDRGGLHGANLSVRLDAYDRVGGFAEVADQEDVLLVRALRAGGASVVGGTRVTTSGRRLGRVPSGFATYLAGLDDELGATPDEVGSQA